MKMSEIEEMTNKEIEYKNPIKDDFANNLITKLWKYILYPHDEQIVTWDDLTDAAGLTNDEFNYLMVYHTC